MAAPDRLRLVEDLRDALRRRSFTLQYQPVVALDTGSVDAAEALLRWPRRNAPYRGPAGFLPTVEEAGLIPRLGAWTLRRAAADAAAWTAPLTVSVNVSPTQFAHGALIGHIAAALYEAELPPERLEIDITQPVALAAADEDVLLTLAALRDRGVGVALGDFGAGPVSLATLKHLPLTALKLHRSLLAGAPEDPADAGMLRAAVAAARALGVTLTAVGVETPIQAEFLALIGVDRAQGFLYGRAVPATMIDGAARAMELAAG